METQNENIQECCPKFEPKPWDEKIFVWEHKKFIEAAVFTMFYLPMNFGSVMKKLDHIVRNAGATMPDGLCMSDHTSQWNMDLYLAVDKVIPEAENTTLSGKYFSKVYEGPYKNTGQWSKDFGVLTQSKGYHIKKEFLWYTTCPKCARKYGKNYVVIIGQVE